MPFLAPLDQLKHLAVDIEGIDVDCYRRHGRDLAAPLVGLGPPEARWCFFGRDPGEHEVRLQRPFGGPAGRKIRAVMAQLGLGDGDARREVHPFWRRTDKDEAQVALAPEPSNAGRRFTLLPVPHPSRANAAGATRFPDLLRSRLRGGAGC